MSDNGKLLIVLGATGLQGGAVLRHYVRYRPEFRLRGISRDPTKSTAVELSLLGVEMVKADLKDEESLRRAFEGATHIFANIDSVELIFEGIQQPELLQPGESPFQRGMEQEALLGGNVIRAAADCSTLERIIWSTLPEVSERSGGKYTRVTHFDAKATVKEMFLADQTIGPKTSFLYVGLYFDMPIRTPALYPIVKNEGGVYELILAMTGDEVEPFANVALDAGSWAAALFAAPPGTKLIGSSEMLSWKQWIQRWAEHNGVQARYSQCSEETQMSYMGGAGLSTMQAMRFVEEYGMAGGDPEAVLPRDVGASTTPVAEAMTRVDWSPIL